MSDHNSYHSPSKVLTNDNSDNGDSELEIEKENDLPDDCFILTK